MKQIIMDLADKAIEDMPKMRWEIPDEFCEKFAELIVEECTTVIEQNLFQGIGWNTSRAVRKHFGIGIEE
jgi:hypothetical protein